MPSLHGEGLAAAAPADQKIDANRDKQPNLTAATQHERVSTLGKRIKEIPS